MIDETTNSNDAEKQDVAPGGQRGIVRAIVAVAVVVGIYFWGQSLLRQENPIELKSHQVVETAEGWFLMVEAFNHGPAAELVYVEAKYFTMDTQRQEHIRKQVRGVEHNQPCGIRLVHWNALTRTAKTTISVYVGTKPHLYMGM